MTDQRSVGLQTPDSAIPPPPDGSGIVPVASSSATPAEQLPPPPDGSGIAPGQGGGTVTQGGFADELPPQPATRMSPEDVSRIQDMVASGQSADTIRAYLNSKGFSDQGDTIGKAVAYAAAHPGYRPGHIDALPKVQSQGGFAALTNHIAQGATANFGDEAVGAAAGFNAMANGGSFTDAYDRSVDQTRAELGSDEQDHPWLSLGGELAGGAILPYGVEKSGLTISARAVGSAARDAAIAEGFAPATADRIAARAVAHRLTAEGGAYGGLYGAGNAQGGPSERLGGALTGGAAGAAGGAVLPYAASAASKAAGAVGRGVQSVADLATGNMDGRVTGDALKPFLQEDVPALAADVGGTGAKMASGFSNMTLGGIPLSNAARRSVAAAQDLKNAIASRIGNPVRTLDGQSDTFGAGLVAQRGVKEVLGDGGTKETIGNGLYQAIPISKGTNASTTNTQAALSDINAGLESNPELSALIADPRMAAYQNAFTGKTTAVPTGILDANGNSITRDVTSGGKLNWGDLQSFRSYIGELAGRPTLQSDTSQSALRQLYAGLSEDMRSTAAAQGDDALAKFTRANNYWRSLQARRDEVLKPLLGNDLSASGADAFRQIERWSSNTGDVAALGRTLRSMPDDAANDVRATLFDRLGTVSKGRQDETGTVWSPNDFMTHWSGLSSRAKANLFPSADYRQSIDNLVQIASRAKAAQAYSNVSKTGNVANGIALLTGFFSNPLGTLPVAMGELGVGKLLGSPRFANWLGSSIKKPNAEAMLAHVNRLSNIAKAEPAIAAPALHLQQRLASAFQSAPNRAAAQQPSNSMGVTNGQDAQSQPNYQGTAP